MFITIIWNTQLISQDFFRERMRKNPKKRSKSATSTIANLPPCVAYRNVKGRIKTRVKSITNYITELPVMVKISGSMLSCILGFFSCLGPVWNFFFLKTSKPAEPMKPDTSEDMKRFKM